MRLTLVERLTASPVRIIHPERSAILERMIMETDSAHT